MRILWHVRIEQRVGGGQVAVEHFAAAEEDFVDDLFAIEAQGNGLAGSNVAEEVRAIDTGLVAVVILGWDDTEIQMFPNGARRGELLDLAGPVEFYGEFKMIVDAGCLVENVTCAIGDQR